MRVRRTYERRVLNTFTIKKNLILKDEALLSNICRNYLSPMWLILPTPLTCFDTLGEP